MTPDFVIRLILATHKVVDILPKQDVLGLQIKDSANKLLESLVLITQTNPITAEQKKSIAPKAIRELGVIIAYLNYAKRMSEINPENFLVLEQEYSKVGDFLRKSHQNIQDTAEQSFAEISKPRSLGSTKELLGRAKEQVPTTFPKEELSGRQTRILELIRNKDKTQVWELQKVLPEVTKRTLRRDIDDLLQRKLIIRQGEWNEVFYQIR